MRNNPTLPDFKLSIFDEAADKAAADQTAADKAAADKAASDKAAADRASADRAAADRAAADKAAADKAAADKAAADRAAGDIRNQRGQFESREEYEARIKTLNDENAERRRENRELKGSLTVLERRAIRGDVLEAIRSANPFDEKAVSDLADQFMSDMAEHLKVDPKTGNTVGLEKIKDWKTQKSYFFKPEETADQKTAREAAEKKAADDAANAARRGNRTAGAGSRGAGSGGTDTNTNGLPDLSTLNTPAERKAAVDAYKRSLRGGSTGSYGRASSVK